MLMNEISNHIDYLSPIAYHSVPLLFQHWVSDDGEHMPVSEETNRRDRNRIYPFLPNNFLSLVIFFAWMLSAENSLLSLGGQTVHQNESLSGPPEELMVHQKH